VLSVGILPPVTSKAGLVSVRVLPVVCRLYGATTVCYSCRIFFRRTVKSKQELKCARGAQDLCNFDKSTRSSCRKCRYGKCLQIGMNPLLVDNCRKVEKQEENVQSKQTKHTELNHRSTVIVAKQSHSPSSQNLTYSRTITPIVSSVATSLQTYTRESLENIYKEICDKILLDPQGDYMQKLFEVDKRVIEQARSNKMKIEVTGDYISTCKTITESVSTNFLRKVLPGLSDSYIQGLASSTSITLLGLSAGVQQCFCDGSMLDQIQRSFPCSTEFLDFWKRIAPDIDELKALPMEAFAMMTSPWAPKIEHEEFVAETFQQLNEVIDGDKDVSQLLFLLALFSPVNIQTSAEETVCLKQFQSQMSMLVYSHVLGQQEMDNTSALEWVGRIGRIIQDLHKCGQIFSEGVIQYSEEDIMEDIDAIEIGQL